MKKHSNTLVFVHGMFVNWITQVWSKFKLTKTYKMKAVVYRKYGTPDVLELKDIEKPVPESNEVLVKIHSTTVTAGDWRLKKADLKKRHNVLIYGASGSVGTFAVQLAKYFGANVTAVWSTTNINLVKSLGADKVVDYLKEDFTKTETQFDVIFDAVAKTSKSTSKNILKSKGRYVSVRGSAKENSNDLLFLKELIEAGKLKTVIDRRYTL